MNSSFAVMATTSILLLFALPAFADGVPKSETVHLSRDQEKLIDLRSEVVRKGHLDDGLVLPGEVSADEDRAMQIIPRAPGLVREVRGQLGDRVVAGAVLAVIESNGAADAAATYAAARSRATLTKGQAAREQGLWRAGISSRRDYEVAKQAADEAAAMLLGAQQKLTFLGASLTGKAAQDGLGTLPSTVLKAPIDGTLIERHVAVGDQVDESRVLFRLANLDQVWVIANVSESDVGRVELGQNAQVSLPAYPGTAFPGRITWISDVLDPVTRTVRVRVVVPNSDRLLKPGSFVEATLIPVRPIAQLLVATQAIQRQTDQTVVFVSLGNGDYRLQPITIASRTDTAVAVASGLKAGERVVTSGAFSLLSELEKSSFAGDD